MVLAVCNTIPCGMRPDLVKTQSLEILILVISNLSFELGTSFSSFLYVHVGNPFKYKDSDRVVLVF